MEENKNINLYYLSMPYILQKIKVEAEINTKNQSNFSVSIIQTMATESDYCELLFFLQKVQQIFKFK